MRSAGDNSDNNLDHTKVVIAKVVSHKSGSKERKTKMKIQIWETIL